MSSPAFFPTPDPSPRLTVVPNAEPLRITEPPFPGDPFAEKAYQLARDIFEFSAEKAYVRGAVWFMHTSRPALSFRDGESLRALTLSVCVAHQYGEAMPEATADPDGAALNALMSNLPETTEVPKAAGFDFAENAEPMSSRGPMRGLLYALPVGIVCWVLLCFASYAVYQLW